MSDHYNNTDDEEQSRSTPGKRSTSKTLVMKKTKGDGAKYSCVHLTDDDDDDDDGENGQDVLANPGNPKQQQKQQQSSVVTDDNNNDDQEEEDENKEEEGDEEMASLTSASRQKLKKRRAQLPDKWGDMLAAMGRNSNDNSSSNNQPSTGSIVLVLWMSLMGVMIVTAMGLLWYRHYTSRHSQEINEYNLSHDDDYYHHGQKIDFYNSKNNNNNNDDDDVEVSLANKDNNQKKKKQPNQKDSITPVDHVNSSNNKPKNSNTDALPYHSPQKPRVFTIHYDPMPKNWDPFDLRVGETTNNSQGGALSASDDLSSFLPWMMAHHDDDHDDDDHDNDNDNDNDDDDMLHTAYLMQPNIVNNTLVFVTEGDLYVTRIANNNGDDDDDDDDDSKTTLAKRKRMILPAFKLTTTAGNVRTPVLHPTLPLVAYTATYHGRREVYLQDWRLRPRGRRGTAAQRVTYWGESSYGVRSIVGWKNATTLIVSAPSVAVSLPDTRLYLITLASKDGGGGGGTTTNSLSATPLQITPVPLSQAIHGVYDDNHKNRGDSASSKVDGGEEEEENECFYFTRFEQSSHTVRYVGGTVESLWVYCEGQDVALKLIDSNANNNNGYNGTSKYGTLYTHPQSKQRYLVFLSDRTWDDNQSTWIPTTMNLWAWPLDTASPMNFYQQAIQSDAVQAVPMPWQPVQLTQISCEFNGQALQEYSMDPVTGNIVIRVGSDLHLLTLGGDGQQVLGRLSITPLRIQVLSDFQEASQERLLPLTIPKHFTAVDAFTTTTPGGGGVAALLTVRGQAWVSPILGSDDSDSGSISDKVIYQGAGQALPPRTYRLAPGALTGGAMRVLVARNVPLPTAPLSLSNRNQRMAVVLATDPSSATAEHAFYLVPSQAGVPSMFGDLQHLPRPFLGGGDNPELGSVHAEDVVVSPCGRRMAWTDTNGRVLVMTLPLYNETLVAAPDIKSTYHVLPDKNELGEPIVGVDAELRWSPGGRYLAINHLAANQFYIISIADCGDPAQGSIQGGRIVQATPSRFNSMEAYWGISSADAVIQEHNEKLALVRGDKESENDKDDDDNMEDAATTLYFLTDRDVQTDTPSPWGTRMPLPHFSSTKVLYALPLNSNQETLGRFGGAEEIFADQWLELDEQVKTTEKVKAAATTADSSTDNNSTTAEPENDGAKPNKKSSDTKDAAEKEEAQQKEDKPEFPKDLIIDFGPADLSFARRAYRVANIPKGKYLGILSQTDDGSFVLVGLDEDDDAEVRFFKSAAYPLDDLDETPVSTPLLIAYGLSTCRGYVKLVSRNGAIQIVSNSLPKIAAATKDSKSFKADSDQIALSVWPKLEYKQMYNDAWRMLRDYFYDRQMHQVDWKAVHERYLPLVDRCNKREELDDVLAQMAAELSALHVFVYGGEYNAPLNDDPKLTAMHKPASLGATLERTAEWKGYRITEIAYRDPDFSLLENKGVYSPLSDQTLRLTGQKGLEVGDVIVGVDGESVFRVPDIHMLLRGREGHSVRLDVLRLASGVSGRSPSLPLVSNATDEVPVVVAFTTQATPEPVLVVPISQLAAEELRYTAWEYKTRQTAKALAQKAGFALGYIHLRSMSTEDMDAFARGYFEDYDKDAMILDLRHNRGGNIDSWISSFLQRKAWSFFADRTNHVTGRDMNWNQHFAFRGRLVVLVDEKTSSDGEGISRSLSELGLGYLIGKRTWGGGIWLSSDNRLVDGGIATAPEAAVYNDKWGWGMGIEQQGVSPDLEVDNNPRTSFDGVDTQLVRAIEQLSYLLAQDPVTVPKPPGPKPDMSAKGEKCQAVPP